VHTILVEDVQALLHQQRRVKDNQAIAYGQHVIARPGLEEGSNGSLASWSAQRCMLARQHVSPVPSRPAVRGLRRIVGAAAPVEGTVAGIAAANL
jgi:hypothetical protein